MAKCQELGHKGGKYDYIVADMADLNSTENVVKVRQQTIVTVAVFSSPEPKAQGELL